MYFVDFQFCFWYFRILSKDDCKISVSFKQIWNFKVSNLTMAKVKKVNIAVTFISPASTSMASPVHGSYMSFLLTLDIYGSFRRSRMPVHSGNERAQLRRPPESNDGLLRPRTPVRRLQLPGGLATGEGQRGEVLPGDNLNITFCPWPSPIKNVCGQV